jgi:SAM-dependent methyltransferase
VIDPKRDAFGRALLDWVQGGTEPEIFQRDDGFFETGAGPEVYLAPFRQWHGVERQTMRFVRGRVLDIGCGAGRVGLHLQRRGFDVVGVDHSSLALRACRLRGLRRTELRTVDGVRPLVRRFDTLVLFGNNVGLFGNPERARRLLSAWARVAGPRTRILAESMSPYHRSPAVHRAYHRRNRERGRMPGQARLRVRYREIASPWFDWLFVSPHEMRRIVGGTGWKITRVLGPDDEHGLFVAVLEKA